MLTDKNKNWHQQQITFSQKDVWLFTSSCQGVYVLLKSNLIYKT